MNRQNLWQILKWGISIAILWMLVVSFDFAMLSKSFLGAKVSLLLLVLAIGFGSICLSVLRWQASLRVQGIHPPFRSLLTSTLVSGFVGFLLPSFGEDAVWGYDLYKFSSKRGVNIAASILFERICGLLGRVGSGRFTAHAIETGAMVVSVDLSSAVVVNAKIHQGAQNFLGVQADLANLPFKDNFFDKVFCLGVIQHTPSPEEFFPI